MLYELTDVTKHYTQRRKQVAALAGIDLTIDEGEFLAIQGSTGSGKTTLLQMLGAMDRPSGGKLDFEGRDLAKMGERDLSELRSHSFGFIFQGFNLIPTLTAQENVETALVPWHVAADERRRRAEEALAGVGLADRARHIPSELSGGEQQRVAIARALVRAPRVILADEPTGNLDERTRDDIIGLLEELWRERGQTLIVVTHDTWVASRASRRIWLDAGRIEEEDGRRSGSRRAIPRGGRGGRLGPISPGAGSSAPSRARAVLPSARALPSLLRPCGRYPSHRAPGRHLARPLRPGGALVRRADGRVPHLDRRVRVRDRRHVAGGRTKHRRTEPPAADAAGVSTSAPAARRGRAPAGAARRRAPAARA